MQEHILQTHLLHTHKHACILINSNSLTTNVTANQLYAQDDWITEYIRKLVYKNITFLKKTVDGLSINRAVTSTTDTVRICKQQQYGYNRLQKLMQWARIFHCTYKSCFLENFFLNYITSSKNKRAVVLRKCFHFFQTIIQNHKSFPKYWPENFSMSLYCFWRRNQGYIRTHTLLIFNYLKDRFFFFEIYFNTTHMCSSSVF